MVTFGDDQTPVPNGARPHALPPTWPLTGRATELAVLTERTLGAGTVLITGGPGVGRTRMAREVGAVVAGTGREVLWTAGTAVAAAVPLGAMAHLVPPADAEQAPDAFVRLQQAVAALTARPLVLVVDDAHLLDELSLGLLHQLAHSGRVSLVVTAPADTAAPDRLAGLWRDDTATRLDLRSLSRADSDRLLTATLDGDVDTRTVERLWALSRGNPLYLRELVDGGLDSGRLHRDRGIWRWDGEMAPTQRLVDIVLGRLEGLDQAERATLEVLAIGEPLGLDGLIALTGRDAVAALERRGLLTVDAEHGLVRTADPLHAEVVRARTPQATSSRLRRRLAVGTHSGPLPDDLLRTSRLALRGECGDLDPIPLLRAARQANTALDHGRAEQLARAAVLCGAGLDGRLTLIEAVLGQGKAAETEEIACSALPLATGQHDHMRLVIMRALNLAIGLGRGADADAVLDRAAATGGPRSSVTATRALIAIFDHRPHQAVEWGREVLDRTPAGGGVVRSIAAAAVASGLAMTGSAEESTDVAVQGWTELTGAAPESDATLARLALAHTEMLALRLAGRFRDMERRATELHLQSMRSPEGAGDAVAALHVGCAALAAGRLRRAARWLTEALAGLRRRDPAGLLPLCSAELARVHALLGDSRSAAELLDPTSQERSATFEPQLSLARAWHTAIATGPVPAVDVVLGSAERAAHRGEWAAEAELLHAAVQLGDAAAAGPQLRALGDRTGNALIIRCADHAAAAVAGCGLQLDDVAAGFEEMGAQLLAADAAAAATAAHQRAGDRHRASRSGTRAARLAVLCDTPRTPALDQLTPPRLTAREQEVADLVAAGLSNAAIADRLVLSVRTVEAHLAHAYAKLGVNSRAALRDALAPMTR